MIEFLQSHTNVFNQPSYDNPSAEDHAWFPDIAGSDWQTSLDFAMRNFKDESLIAQYLSPRLMRKLRMFTILNDDQETDMAVTSIHDAHGYRKIPRALAESYNLGSRQPNIQVWNVDLRADRSLTLHHTRKDRRALDDSANEVMKHTKRLWGFPVRVHEVDEHGDVLKAREI